jgi:2,3-bisphosphoglycerate-dependent phosphoglycerate mutase
MSNYLVLLRHGQSQWNLENRFTGFYDIDLSDLGRQEAAQAGKLIQQAGIRFDNAFSSTLQRASNTALLALQNSGAINSHLQSSDGQWYMTCHDDLRERDYGDLTGLNKDETRQKYGDEQVHIWRRSYDVQPPGGESLKDVVDRVRPYFEQNILPLLKADKNVLIGAHGNTLRAMLIVIGEYTPETIHAAEIPTGSPLAFEFEGGEKKRHYYLADELAA